jgi:hypothetical protein
MSKTYTEQLRDPRWQEKRPEILHRDGFMCCICQDTEKELHVHHQAYRRGVPPWGYDDNEYCTLCRDCHAETEEMIREVRWRSGFGPTDEIIKAALEHMRFRSWESFGRLSKIAESWVGQYCSDNYQI